MSARRSLVLPAAFALAACGSPGLEPTVDPTLLDPQPGSLRLQPAGELDFGAVSPEGGRARADFLLIAEGDAPVRVFEAFLDEMTSLAFTLPEDLPVPVTLEPGDEAAVALFFEPYAVGEYMGGLVVVTEDGEGERELVLDLAGTGCLDADADQRCD